MSNDQNQRRRSNPRAAGEPIHYEPPGWLSTEEIEQELLLAVIADANRPRAEARFQWIDDYFAGDKPETEVQYRRSLLRLLADLRPQLAELVGGPRKYE
jgi:hypothetical protein